MKKKKNIVVCPLDWGLGHATRMVPVIEMLKNKGANVIIAADNRPLAFLQQRFPQLEFVKFPGFVPVYPEKGPMALSMLKSLPQMLKQSQQSNKLLQKLVAEKQIDVVISDNRYEAYPNKIPSVFITHQLNIQTPGLLKTAQPILKKTINTYIRKYSELWIPDLSENPNLSGELSHVTKMPVENAHFIGLLSRFSGIGMKQTQDEAELLILISGPEPQRSIFEEKMIRQAQQTSLKTIILQGKPEASGINESGNVKIIPHLPDAEMANLIQAAKIVISRPGYSTLMDLAVFGKKAVFVPTPGQTEQEYLAQRLMKQGIAFYQNQDKFQLSMAIVEAEKYSGLPKIEGNHILEKRIDLLLGEV